jgi:hypothetical protein
MDPNDLYQHMNRFFSGKDAKYNKKKIDPEKEKRLNEIFAEIGLKK